MARLSNCLFIVLNILGLISGGLAIGSYIYFQINGVTDCKNVVQKPLIALGIIFVVISLLGLIGTLWKLSDVLWFYSFVALLVLVGLTAFSIFAYMVDNPNASKGLSLIGFKKHKLAEQYSQWLKNMVENGNQWNGIRACLIHNHVCNGISNNNFFQNASDFDLVQHLSPIEYGCCKPPIACGYEYKKGTLWVVPKSGAAIKDSDCKSWSNNEEKLCYNCNTCKAGVFEESRMTWILFATLDFFDIAILILMYALSCCTRIHILSDSKYNRIRGLP